MGKEKCFRYHQQGKGAVMLILSIILNLFLINWVYCLKLDNKYLEDYRLRFEEKDVE